MRKQKGRIDVILKSRKLLEYTLRSCRRLINVKDEEWKRLLFTKKWTKLFNLAEQDHSLKSWNCVRRTAQGLEGQDCKTNTEKAKLLHEFYSNSSHCVHHNYLTDDDGNADRGGTIAFTYNCRWPAAVACKEMLWYTVLTPHAGAVNNFRRRHEIPNFYRGISVTL